MWCKQCNDGSPMIAFADDPNLWECVACCQVFYLDDKRDGPPIPFHIKQISGKKIPAYPAPDETVEPEAPWRDRHAQPTRSFETQHHVASPHFSGTRNLRKRRMAHRTPLLFWLTLFLGVVAFTCGGSTIAWSLWGRGDDIWQIGIPIAFAGQAILFVTFVLQLEWLTERTAENSQLIRRMGRWSTPAKRRPRKLKTQFLPTSNVKV